MEEIKGVKYELVGDVHRISTKDNLNCLSVSAKAYSKREAIDKAKRWFKQAEHELKYPHLYSDYINIKTGFKVLLEDYAKDPQYYENSNNYDLMI